MFNFVYVIQKCIITIEIIGYMSHSVCHCLSTRLEGVFFPVVVVVVVVCVVPCVIPNGRKTNRYSSPPYFCCRDGCMNGAFSMNVVRNEI